MSAYGMGVRNGVNMPNAEWARQQHVLDKSRADPPVYGQPGQVDPHKIDRTRELYKGPQY